MHSARIFALSVSAALLASCGGGGGSAADTTPRAFAFQDQAFVALSTVVTSNAVTITGITVPTPVTVTGGEYSIGCSGAFTSAAGEIDNNGTVCVRHTSAATPSTRVDTVLTIGGVAGTFSSTTTCGDTAPDAFTFTDQADVPRSTLVTSDTLTITGLCVDPVPVTVTGDPTSVWSVNGGPFAAAPGTVSNGDTVAVRHGSAASYDASVDTTLTVGGVSDTFTSTTLAGPIVALDRAFPSLSFSRPVFLAQAPDDDTRWFVVEQSGVVRNFANSQAATTTSTFIDISARVGESSGERGLYSIAFDPGFAVNGYVYLSYTRSSPSLTSYVSRFASADGGLTLDPATEVVILTLPQPFSNHNGGQIAFGPDGFLYVGFGDGGSGNDPGNRAQDTTNLFGTILRLNVAALPYTIPGDNPFAGNARCPTGSGTVACPEIYAWGLRNPWRFSFDRFNGDLWAADVGQDAWEEIDVIENGGNYGWRIREGAHCNIPSSGCSTAGLIDPVAEYGHSLGESVTGGYVYRGSQVPALAGSYLFGDYISGRLFRLAPGGSQVEELLDTAFNIASFGEGNDGEVYVVDYGGELYHVVAAP